VERYLKVVHPVWSQNKLRGWTEYLAMVAAWIVSFIANVAVVFPTSDVIDGVCYAYMIWKNQKARLFYFVWNFVSFYLVIIFVFVFCYGRILLVIRRQSRVMASHTAEGSGVAQNQCSRIQSSVTRTMVLVSALYAISWLPSCYVYFLFVSLHPYPISHDEVYYASILLAYSYMFTNPFIYIKSWIQSEKSCCVLCRVTRPPSRPLEVLSVVPDQCDCMETAVELCMTLHGRHFIQT